MTAAAKIVKAVDAPAAVEFLAGLVRQPSVGGAPIVPPGRSETSGSPGEAALARFLVQQMAALGLEARLQPVAGERCNAVGVWRGTGGGRSVLFNGHLDTNPVGEGWTVDPWGAVLREGCLYGIGSSNMKAGDAAGFWAVKTLIERGVRLAGDVILSFVVGELEGGIGTLKAIQEGLRADCVIVGEPTDLAALTVHAGAFNFVIELTGATRHLSKRQEAVDALAAACALAPRINAAVFRGADKPAHRAVNRAHVGLLHAALGRQFNETRPPQVADFARLAGSARYAPSQSQESVLADLRAMLEELKRQFPGLEGSVFAESGAEGRPAMLPFEAPADDPAVRAVSRAYQAVRRAPQPSGAVAPMCFYWTDAAHWLHRAGMSGVVCGPGGRYNTMPDERVDLADYLDAIRIYMLALIELCG